MNKTYIELLSKVLNAAGAAGAHGFAYLVQWEWAYSITTLITSSLTLIALLIMARFLWAWKIDKRNDYIELLMLAKALGIGICGLAALLIFCNTIQPAIQIMMSPQGAAVCEMLPGCSPGVGN